MQHFTVCMSVYKNDSPTDFTEAINSVYKQTCPPDEIILVIDGPIPNSIEKTIDMIKRTIPILRIVPLDKNMGHAVARQTGLNAAKNELCAVMDADDIAVPNRFEKQLKAFSDHPDVSVVGGIINEFIGDPNNIAGIRLVPENDSEIKEYLKSRCPMNLVTVMMKKSDVMDVGGYLDWYCEEDYYLWIRLALSGYKFYNIQENLVNVRVGDEMYRRRGGKKYFVSEARLQRYMYQKGIISCPRMLYNVVIRFIVQIAMPNKLRGWVFKKFARR